MTYSEIFNRLTPENKDIAFLHVLKSLSPEQFKAAQRDVKSLLEKQLAEKNRERREARQSI